MEDHFGDGWYGLGFSLFRSTDPYLLARSTGRKETETSVEGSSPFSLLDNLA